MTLFLILYIFALIIISQRSKFTVFTNVYFWLFVFWTLIIGVYFTSGIHHYYGLSIVTLLFLSACLFTLCYFSNIGKHKKTLVFENSEPLKNGLLFVIAGLIGAFLYTWDYVRLNGLASSKEQSDISIVGSVGSLFIPILLVVGIYLNAYKLNKNNRFSVVGILLIFVYSLPCMINAGRESILFGILSILCLYGYNKTLSIRQKRQNVKKSVRSKAFIIIAVIVCLAASIYLLIQLSITRFGQNEINVLLSKNDISSVAMSDAENWGGLEFLYYNIASYFSHEIPFLDFTLREYDGPYMCGMYELNIVSRRLPDALGLDYNLVYRELERLFSIKAESFSGGWNTVLGSFIIDFTWVGAIFACGLCGFAIGKIKKKYEYSLDERYATLVALLCLSTFSTIQLGPFYQTQIYGAYIWWYIMFRKKEVKRI